MEGGGVLGGGRSLLFTHTHTHALARASFSVLSDTTGADHIGVGYPLAIYGGPGTLVRRIATERLRIEWIWTDRLGPGRDTPIVGSATNEERSRN